MSQILRAMRMEVMQIRRFCRSQRNMSNHYETLRIPQDASQRDIRQAFIKLSKEMHPDTSKKMSHAEFVKICDAYQVLSKTYTRQQYDSNLQFGKGARGRSFRVVYYESDADRFGSQNWQRSPNDPYSNYGAKTGTRMTKVTIVMMCLLFSSIGFATQMLLVNKSMTFNRERLMEESKKHAMAYRKLREDASRLSKEEQLAAYERRRIASKRPSECDVNFVES